VLPEWGISGAYEADPNRRLRTAALAFDALHAWFVAHQGSHRVELSHRHQLGGQPYLGAAAFSGRQREQAQADSFLRTQLGEAPPMPGPAASVLVFSGEAGICKSRLTQRIRRQAQRLGYAVHSLAAQRERGAFEALVRLQQHFHAQYEAALRYASPEEISAQHDTHDKTYMPDRSVDLAYALLRQPEIRPEERPAYNELMEQYLLDRFAAEVRLASYRTPLCLCIEDAQWLDAGTLKYVFWCMRVLASSRAKGWPVRVAWVLNHRPKDSEGDNVEQLEAQLASLARLEEVPLRIALLPFSSDDAAHLVASMLQLSPAEADVHRLVETLKSHRELSPLYVEQGLWALFSHGSLAAAEPGQRWQGAWKLDAASLAQSVLPSSVREAIGSRASRLSAETLRILGVAGVVGKAFDVEVVARAANVDAEEVLSGMEQAGAAGFVVQEQGSSRQSLADGEEGDIRYSFSHDRYRDSILGGLESSAKRTVHRELARAILAKWGECSETYPMLAEHYFGSEEYALAYRNARKVAELAHQEGNHERAAGYFRMALDSQGLVNKDSLDAEKVLELRDQAAESMAAVGRFEEANVQLRMLMNDEEVPRHKQLDCQRRIADGYLSQHDNRNATEQLLNLLALLGVDLRTQGRKQATRLLAGALAILVRGPIGLGVNRQPAKNPHEEMTIMHSLQLLTASGGHVDFRILIEAILCMGHRAMTRGLHPFSPVPFVFVSMLLASQGLRSLSVRYERLLMELFPEFEINLVQEDQDSLTYDPSSNREATVARAMTYAFLLLVTLYRGELLGPHVLSIHYKIRQGIRFADMAADIQTRWSARLTSYYYCLFVGRLSSYTTQIQACIDMYRQARIHRSDRILTPQPKAVLHEVAGRLTQAAACYQESANQAQQNDSFLEYGAGRGSALLCVALDDALPPASLVKEAIATATEWLERRMTFSVFYCLASLLAAAAVTPFRHGAKEIPAEFRWLMWRARLPGMAERQQRSIYLATRATLSWMQGRSPQALALFAEATTKAAQEGYLFQLLIVLRIAVRVLPRSHAAHDYYRDWLLRLQQNLLDQPAVKLRDIEAAIFPPLPDSGQPLGSPPR
jgi:hypothetical protein